METRRAVERLYHLLQERGETLTTAESCTGGLVAAFLTEQPGMSAVFPGGFVTYSIAQKEKMLGIPADLLSAHGAVSREAAQAMAEGAARETGADMALAVTGNAGPEGSEDKPVGLVYLGLYYRGDTQVQECRFAGDRLEIRRAACLRLLDMALARLTGEKEP